MLLMLICKPLMPLWHPDFQENSSSDLGLGYQNLIRVEGLGVEDLGVAGIYGSGAFELLRASECGLMTALSHGCRFKVCGRLRDHIPCYITPWVLPPTQ